ncbi:DNAH6 [Cordylochernes scorpioides]|uniref:DNAH6 n=1 Tax=Cordylochernes scorpioides TaxID=51811 RepID=A0ABY6LL37_9ARAC|nr:DNAH6 [Cordylochernes scorpioides]
MKHRHWEALEAKVNIKLVDPPANMRTLETNRIFDYGDAIQDLSGQASSEAGLEGMLNKIEEQWQHTEFVILSHRNQKDVYILGATDDIVALLDESLVNIFTIASSRYVGPFQERVDQWKKQLDLFSKTLVSLTYLLQERSQWKPKGNKTTVQSPM